VWKQKLGGRGRKGGKAERQKGGRVKWWDGRKNGILEMS